MRKVLNLPSPTRGCLSKGRCRNAVFINESRGLVRDNPYLHLHVAAAEHLNPPHMRLLSCSLCVSIPCDWLAHRTRVTVSICFGRCCPVHTGPFTGCFYKFVPTPGFLNFFDSNKFKFSTSLNISEFRWIYFNLFPLSLHQIN